MADPGDSKIHYHLRPINERRRRLVTDTDESGTQSAPPKPSQAGSGSDKPRTNETVTQQTKSDERTAASASPKISKARKSNGRKAGAKPASIERVEEDETGLVVSSDRAQLTQPRPQGKLLRHLPMEILDMVVSLLDLDEVRNNRLLMDPFGKGFPEYKEAIVRQFRRNLVLTDEDLSSLAVISPNLVLTDDDLYLLTELPNNPPTLPDWMIRETKSVTMRMKTWSSFAAPGIGHLDTEIQFIIYRTLEAFKLLVERQASDGTALPQPRVLECFHLCIPYIRIKLPSPSDLSEVAKAISSPIETLWLNQMPVLTRVKLDLVGMRPDKEMRWYRADHVQYLDGSCGLPRLLLHRPTRLKQAQIRLPAVCPEFFWPSQPRSGEIAASASLSLECVVLNLNVCDCGRAQCSRCYRWTRSCYRRSRSRHPHVDDEVNRLKSAARRFLPLMKGQILRIIEPYSPPSAGARMKSSSGRSESSASTSPASSSESGPKVSSRNKRNRYVPENGLVAWDCATGSKRYLTLGEDWVSNGALHPPSTSHYSSQMPGRVVA